MAKDKRICGNIEVLRFFLTMLVASMHYWANVYGNAGLFEGGYLAVDAFFMISGYFLAVSYNKRSDNPWKYTFNKFSHMFWIYESSILFSIFVTSYSEITMIPRRIIASLPDILGLQMTGFYFPVSNGILWYISSMLIASLIIAALYQRNKEMFVNSAAPIIILISYSLIYYYNGNLDAIVKDASFIVPLGNLRGLAGMSCGILIYTLTVHLGKIAHSGANKFFFSALEIFALSVFGMCVVGLGHTKWDFIALIAVSVVLVVASTKQTFWSGVSDSVGNWLSRVMGKQFTLTAYVFSTSVYQVLLKITNIEKMNRYHSLFIYLTILIVFSFIVTHLIGCLERSLKKISVRKEIKRGTKI